MATATQPLLGLSLGALVFLFPFHYMVVGTLQREPNSDESGAFPNPAILTLDNLRDINQAINLPRTLLNSGIFTGGVLLCTLLLGYSLARLEFRGVPPGQPVRGHPGRRGGAGDPGLRAGPAHRPEPVPQHGRAAVPRAGARPGRRARVRAAAPAHVGPVVGQPGRGRPAARAARPAARHLGVVHPGQGGPGRPRPPDQPPRPPAGRPARATLGGGQAGRRHPAAAGRRRLAGPAPRGGRAAGGGPRRPPAGGPLQHRGDAARPRGRHPGGGPLGRAAAGAGAGRRARGVVPNVVFPTAIDHRSEHEADVYYGMADARIGAFRLAMAPLPRE